MGYPFLDINQYSDGSWDIIQYENSPVMPCLTRYRTILGNMKNIEISKAFVKKYIDEIDLTKKAAWAREEAKTKKVYAERAAQDRARDDRIEAAFKAMRYNPDLMERVARNGTGELNLEKIARHVNPLELAAQRKSYNSSI